MPSKQVRRLLEDACIDCYDVGEELTGISTMVEDNLHTPFDTVVLGIPVTVELATPNDRGEIIAICSSGPHRQAISIADLPLPSPPPEGHEWIEAYRWWAQQRM